MAPRKKRGRSWASREHSGGWKRRKRNRSVGDERAPSERGASKGWKVYLIGFVRSGSKRVSSTYIGATVDVKRRVRQHNGEIKGGAKSTNRRGGVWKTLCYVQGFSGENEALRYEWRVKHSPPGVPRAESVAGHLLGYKGMGRHNRPNDASYYAPVPPPRTLAGNRVGSMLCALASTWWTKSCPQYDNPSTERPFLTINVEDEAVCKTVVEASALPLNTAILTTS